jgi:xanthine dehydrogenase accessory factor
MDPEGQRLLQRLPDWLPDRSKPAVLVTVFAVDGSAPRQVGARLLARGGKLLAGTIGGGHLEEQAVRDSLRLAEGALEADDADAPAEAAVEVQVEADSEGHHARLNRYPLGPQLAQCCGGVVWLHFQAVDTRKARQISQQILALEATGGTYETRFGQGALRERPTPVPVVLLCGAGHVGAALARVLQPLPWRVIVLDARPDWADPMRFPLTTEIACTEPLRLLAAWGWLGPEAQQSLAAAKASTLGRIPPAPPPQATHAIVMTHDHALDREIVDALLHVPVRTKDPAAALAYLGMIGSKTKVATLQQRLRRRGTDPELLARLTAPIGLHMPDGRMLGGKLPGEIAISVAAQLLSLQ